MEISNITLSQEVYRSDAEKICYWLSDEEIISNLNEHLLSLHLSLSYFVW